MNRRGFWLGRHRDAMERCGLGLGRHRHAIERCGFGFGRSRWRGAQRSMRGAQRSAVRGGEEGELEHKTTYVQYCNGGGGGDAARAAPWPCNWGLQLRVPPLPSGQTLRSHRIMQDKDPYTKC